MRYKRHTIISILLFLLILSASHASEEFRIITQTPKGRIITLYERSYALVIGIGDYHSGWHKLRHSVKEASKIAESVRKRGFEVRTLFNPDSDSLKEILSLIPDEVNGEKSRFLFYFGGHGETITDDNGEERGFILPVDTPKPETDRNGFLDKAISMRSIAEWAEEINVRHALFLFDCCFSGRVLTSGWKEDASNQNDFLLPACQFITAGKKNEEVPDYSIFNYCLLNALKGDADIDGDGFQTASEMSLYLYDTVVRRSQATQHPQYGRIHNPENNLGEFIFIPDLMPPIYREKNGYLKSQSQIRELPQNLIHKFRNHDIPEMEFTYIPGGSFVMGSSVTEQDRDDDEGPLRRVVVKSFYLQTTEMTQEQWTEVMGYNPSFHQGDNLPVEQVSWNEVQRFIRRLNVLDPGKSYRLPSEAEWEYACRADSDTRFPWGDDPDYRGLDMFSWTEIGLLGYSHPVGGKLPNGWGLYDMHGNVFEWCDDWYHSHYFEAPVDGSAWLQPIMEHRVYRGGGSIIQAWDFTVKRSRSAYRNRAYPSDKFYDVGFRLVKVRE